MNNQKKMNYFKRSLVFMSAIIWPFLAITAQEDTDDVDYELSPFTVSTATDRGYVATRSVAGLKTNTAILDMPLNVQVLNRDFLEDIGGDKLYQAMNYISNVTSGDQRNDSGINIRGFGATIRQNGLSYNFANGYRVLDGIERIEVIKGASAALYDTTALGGIINFVHKTAHSNEEALLNFTVGEHDFYKAVVDYNTPLHDDGNLSIAGRIVASYEDSESWRPFAFVERMYVMPTFSFNWNDRTIVNLRFEYQKDDMLQNFASPYIFTGTPPADIPSQATIDPESGLYLLNLPHGFFRGEPSDGKDQFTFSTALDATHYINDTWSMRFATVITEVDQNRLETFISAPKASISVWPRFQQNIPVDFYGFTSELTLLGNLNTGSVSHRALFGLANTDTNSVNANIRMHLQEEGQDVYNPHYGIPLGDEVVSARRRSRTFLDTNSLFIQDQLGFFEDKFLVVLGGRWQSYDRTVWTKNKEATKFTPQETTDDRFFPRYSAVYKASENVSIFAGFSDTSTPNNGAMDVNGVVLPDPTTEINEIGVKGDLNGGKVFSTLSYFKNVRKNLVVADVLNIGASESSGEITSEGFDFDIGVQITDNLELVGGLSNMSNEITADTNPARVGLGFRAIPDFTSSAFLRYDFSEDTPHAGLSLGVGYIHENKRWGDSKNRFRSPAYNKWDLLIKYAWGNNYQFRINVDNVFNKEYWGRVTSERFAQAGDKRWIKATYRVEF